MEKELNDLTWTDLKRTDFIWTDIKMNARTSSVQLMSVQIRSDKVIRYHISIRLAIIKGSKICWCLMKERQVFTFYNKPVQTKKISRQYYSINIMLFINSIPNPNLSSLYNDTDNDICPKEVNNFSPTICWKLYWRWIGISVHKFIDLSRLHQSCRLTNHDDVFLNYIIKGS